MLNWSPEPQETAHGLAATRQSLATDSDQRSYTYGTPSEAGLQPQYYITEGAETYMQKYIYTSA